MATVVQDSRETFASLVARLGDIPLSRIRVRPAPGTATVEDAVRINETKDGLVELVEGVLIERAMGFAESVIALELGRLLKEYVKERNLGLVSGADGMLQVMLGLIRLPDVAYISWDRIPGRKLPRTPAPELVPNLAVEVLSPSNTRREMQRKRQEYFAAGVELVWMVDINERTVTVFTSPTEFTELPANRILSGGNVLPGLELSLTALFAELDQSGDVSTP